jgi:hypothetical protein
VWFVRISKQRSFVVGVLLAVGVLTAGSVVGAKEYREWMRRKRIATMATSAPNSVEMFFVEPAPATEEHGEMMEEGEGERDNPM